MADKIIPTVRVVQLAQKGAADFVWIFEDVPTEEYSPHFPDTDKAKSWLFTPVCVQTPEPPVPVAP